ncbi:MAG: helix-turn-helix transcriptional regulator [Bacteroidales bacterium]
MDKEKSILSAFLKEKRKITKLTQEELALKAGVGLRFIRDIEQGKTSLRMDKVNKVLKLFGHELKPAPIDRSKLIKE